MTSSRKKTDAPESTPAAPKDLKNSQKPQEGIRETVEAVAIAFILAFVFKTFEAEMFVIPTGSMAPTLYGRHKEVQCEACQLDYTIGASQEINQETGIVVRRFVNSLCPNCRHRNNVYSAPAFNGDRIVVNKEVSKYNRFDVVVFKNPEEPSINYIKRLVGLPGEILRIRQGDIQVRRSTSEPWVIQRKADPEKQRDIQLLVYDDRHPPRALLNAGAEERWVPSAWTASDTNMGGWPRVANAWTADAEARTYSVDAKAADLQWLRYRHLVPSDEHWLRLKSEDKLELALQPQLVADFCGFNVDGENSSYYENILDDELYWSNDLTVECTIVVESAGDKSQLVLELVEGARTVQCQIDPISGLAEIVVRPTESEGIADQAAAQAQTIASVQTPVKGVGSYDFVFANVDDRICLWVNDELIPLGVNAEFPSSDLNLPTPQDLAPAGIAVNEMKAVVSNLVIRRDIYYRNDQYVLRPGRNTDSVASSLDEPTLKSWEEITEVPKTAYSDISSLLRDPVRYGQKYAEEVREQETIFGEGQEFKLADDEYLMFGDNSPASKDSRLFDYESRPSRGIMSHRYAVREQDLIGEALYIFWPHGVPFMNDGRGFSLINHSRYLPNGKVEKDTQYPLYSFPFYPNISRMKIIR